MRIAKNKTKNNAEKNKTLYDFIVILALKRSREFFNDE
jgi:hypothetical protein